MDMTRRTGIIGVGELGEAIVTGLSSTPSPLPIHLSPRSAGAARGLATTFHGVRACPSNQAVVEHSDVILLLVRPSDVAEVLAGIQRIAASGLARPGQRGWPPAGTRAHSRQGRATPCGPTVTHTESTTGQSRAGR
ncbi:hypothetical protein CFN78_20790 [Amycolatopsis antarctica]|uniref:Pyrroline-5-carboxylate reductase catalytic N-terminal domain-containing protein n=1 Tax=Amycolatopsis antarctica TaxID=1854586 RepID=A0A263CYK3_9PSEU|nr:NAD(P)-binding domain-containing protein [Amycolatopsis antarctica]OZM71240.1 hypothetical protein CFN78_20790 [Amycolatopsis antarctica]